MSREHNVPESHSRKVFQHTRVCSPYLNWVGAPMSALVSFLFLSLSLLLPFLFPRVSLLLLTSTLVGMEGGCIRLFCWGAAAGPVRNKDK